MLQEFRFPGAHERAQAFSSRLHICKPLKCALASAFAASAAASRSMPFSVDDTLPFSTWWAGSLILALTPT